MGMKYQWGVKSLSGKILTADDLNGTVRDAIKLPEVVEVMFFVEDFKRLIFSFDVYDDTELILCERRCKRGWGYHDFKVDGIEAEHPIDSYQVFGYKRNGVAVENRLYGGGIVKMVSYVC